MPDLPQAVYARNMRLVGHSNQGGRGDGLQVMVHRGYAYVGHPWSAGFTIADVRDPKRPGETWFIPAPPTPGRFTCRRMAIFCWSSTRSTSLRG